MRSEADQHYMHHQADLLAAAILMPKGIFLKAWRNCYSIDEMSEIFVVSPKAVVLRLEMLGVYI